jgi:hypothetical protein
MITTLNIEIEIANVASERLYRDFILCYVEFSLSLWPTTTTIIS